MDDCFVNPNNPINKLKERPVMAIHEVVAQLNKGISIRNIF